MVLARFAPFATAEDGFDRLVRRAFGDFGSGVAARQWAPPLNAFSEGEELVVQLELPGIDPDADLDIEVEDGVLRIAGERKQETKSEGTGWFRSEMSYGRFERRIALPDGADTENIRASYDKGILDVRVPTPPAKQPTKVKVEIGNHKELKSPEGETR